MTKITEPDYFLPEILAEEKNESTIGGATLPLIITGTCKTTYDEDNYVVKFRAGEGMTYNSFIKELIGAFMAMELGINVVIPVVVDVTNDFADTIDVPKEKSIAKNSLGLNYGSKLITGLKPIFKDMEISDQLRKEAIKVLIFDIIINNIDRNYRKPNMLTDGKKIYIFDHEKAFSFMELLSFARNQEPWQIPASELTWIENHFFWKEFKGKILEFESFIDCLSDLNNNFWEKAESLIPEEWSKGSNYFGSIKDHCIKIIDNKDVFKSEIKRILT